MKFYEKFKPITLITLLSIIVLFYSCGGDSNDPSTNEENQNITENFKLLKRVTYTDFWWGEMNLDFSYSNGLLVKVNEGGILLYYEYNSDDKISLSKECSDQNLTDINIDTYNCTAYSPYSNFIYENGKLKTYLGPGNVKLDYEYDNNGNIVAEIDEMEYSAESGYYTYDNQGNIITMELIGSNDNVYTISYEYDGHINPFYVLFKNFGYMNEFEFNPYDLVSPIFKQNPIKVYGDNKLKTEANYTYDTDGYPISCGFTEYLNGGGTRTGTVTFTYQE